MPADRITSLLGLVIKTGRYAKGDALIPSIQKQSAKAVIVSDACGANRRKKLHDKCATYNVPLYTLEAARYDSLGNKAGNSIAVLDPGFAKSLIPLFEFEKQAKAEKQAESHAEESDGASITA